MRRYEHRPEVREALWRALQELAVQPFGNPQLQTHVVKRAQPDTFTSYVDNHGHRLIWRRAGNVIILLLFGEHDAVYRRAERLRLESDDTQNVLRVVDEDPAAPGARPIDPRRPARPADRAAQPGGVAGARRLETVRGTVELTRHGPEPVTVAARDLAEHDLALAAGIQDSVAAGTGPGDVAVLVPTHAQVAHHAEQISGLGLPTRLLTRYDGVPNQLVKVGTYQRAKGLEFKHVFLPRLDADGLREERRRGEDQASYAERLDLVRRRLFVAMTRARDGLWLGWVGGPSSILPAGSAQG